MRLTRPPSIDFGLGGLGDLVVDDLFRFPALVARIGRLGVRGGRGLALVAAAAGISLPTVTWLSRPSLVAEVSSRVWLERTTRPSGSYLSDVWVTRLKSKSALTSVRARPGSDHRRHDRIDLFAQPLLECRPALVGADLADVIVVAGAVGQQVAGFIDDRDPLRLEPVDGGSHEMADGAHLLRLPACREP